MKLSNGIEIPRLVFSNRPTTQHALTTRENCKEPTFLLNELQGIRNALCNLKQTASTEAQKGTQGSSKLIERSIQTPNNHGRSQRHAKTSSFSTTSNSQTCRTQVTSQKDDLLSDKTPILTLSNFHGTQTQLSREFSRENHIPMTTRSDNTRTLRMTRQLSVGKAVGTIRDFYDQRDVSLALNRVGSFNSKIQLIDQVLDRRKELEELEYQIRFEKMTPMIQKFVKNLNRRRKSRYQLANIESQTNSMNSSPRNALSPSASGHSGREAHVYKKSLFHQHGRSLTNSGEIKLVRASTLPDTDEPSEVTNTVLFRMAKNAPKTLINLQPMNDVSLHSLSVLKAIARNKDSDESTKEQPRPLVVAGRRRGLTRKDGIMLQKALEVYRQKQKNKPRRYHHYIPPTSSSPEAIQALEHDIYHYVFRNKQSELAKAIETVRGAHKTINLIEERAVKDVEDEEWRLKTTHTCDTFNKKIENFTKKLSPCRHHRKTCNHAANETKSKTNVLNAKKYFPFQFVEDIIFFL